MNKNEQKCSKKQQKLNKEAGNICQEYLVDMNATQAYKRAGYAVKNDNVAAASSQRMLRNVKIKSKINQAIQKRAEKNSLTADWVLKHLKENLERCMQIEPVVDRFGHETGVFKWEPKAANKSLELIGKHIGMFVDKLEHTGLIDRVDKTLKNISSEKLQKIVGLLSEDDE
jgi:phage terminase small subunit